jgi:lysophospholipase L1-like esterase
MVLNDTVKQRLKLSPTALPEMISVGLSDMRKVKLNFSSQSGITVFGASLEDSTGFYIDNFSIKGNSGLGLLSIPKVNLMKFDSLLNYDLIVLQFGLNAMTPESRKYTAYMEGMARLVNKFKVAFPNTPILMLSVSDRSERREGEFATMKAVKSLVVVQQQFAYDNKLLFWNLYEAMGGENSMTRFVHSNPPLAGKDYTHLNFDGGKIIGHSLARSILYEGEKFTERRRNLVSN